MQDQAAELRSLVLRAVRERAARSGPSPKLVVVSGGRAGVGATTLAINLALALAELASRVVVVDAAPYGSRAAELCGLEPGSTVADVLAARRDVHEVLQRGPGGVQLIAGARPGGAGAAWTLTSQQRLIKQLQGLGLFADVVLLDVGSGSGETAAGFWRSADDVVLVTTPESGAIMDTYATIKSLTAGGVHPRLGLVVSGVERVQVGEEVYQRLSHCCRRFLDVELEWFGSVARDAGVAEAAERNRPLMLADPDSEAARSIQSIAARWSGDACRR